jgi:DNA polymerase-3 subunit epsilon
MPFLGYQKLKTMREVVLDTETTGLSCLEGDRIMEIGCVELWNHIPTGRTFHEYINPEKEVPPEVVKITGLTTNFLKQFPRFSEIVDKFLEFIADSPLVIHNAKFDIQFLNSELAFLDMPPIPMGQAIDTLLIARKQFPGQPASLDALTKRFNINIPREKHGALLDSQILAEVYLVLKGGSRQKTLAINDSLEQKGRFKETTQNHFPYRNFEVSEDEILEFNEMLEKMKCAKWNSV